MSSLGYGNMGNAHRAVQRYIDALPDAGNIARRRVISHQRLDGIWRLAWAKAAEGDVPAMRVLVEIERSRMELEGLKRPIALQVEGSVDGQVVSGPSLRDVLPAEVAADPRSVREQALLLHRALPAGNTRAAGDK